MSILIYEKSVGVTVHIMLTNKRSFISSSARILWFVLSCCFALNAQEAKKAFTVADDIALTLFGNPAQSGDSAQSVVFSPDNEYFAVYSHRGRLDLNVVEDSLSFYRTEDAKRLLARDAGPSNPPGPFWVVSRSAKEAEFREEDGVIRYWRWLANSSGVGFLTQSENGAWQLNLADVREQKVKTLTPRSVSVDVFDIHDNVNFVYTAVEIPQKKPAPSAITVTGDDVEEALGVSSTRKLWFGPFTLRAVVQGEDFPVRNEDASVVPRGDHGFALSPDGMKLATAIDIPAPAEWEKLYPPPFPSASDRIHAGEAATQFVLIDLKTGSVQSLTDAPIADSGGIWANVDSVLEWSRDERSILLPATYLRSSAGIPSRPCVAVVDVPEKTSACVEALKGTTETGVEEGLHNIADARFLNGQNDRVLVTFRDRSQSIAGNTEYSRGQDGMWHAVNHSEGAPPPWHQGLQVKVKEGLNERPVVVVSDEKTSRLLWDPNPQLKGFDLGEVSLYRWKDGSGRAIEGTLYRPVNYQQGHRYPLVIQTHGYVPDAFRPSGTFTTAFAAQEFASMGIAVLQVYEHCIIGGETPNEGPCAVSVYESAVKQLAAEGLVDPERVGVIGFSRTCFYVMRALTMDSTLHLMAASINDGWSEDYFLFTLYPGTGTGTIGARPFGDGLRLWLERAPGFRMDRVKAPLLIMGSSYPTYGGFGALQEWGPYAGLHSLKKPVELIVLNSNEHGITNPAMRMVSQGTNVDWFRFWLQSYEDPDPAKADQYKRWRELRKLQAESEKTASESARVSH